MQQQRQFKFKYEGENFINLNTLLTSQFHFLASVNEIQKQLYPDVEIKLRVGSFSEGSFIVDLFMESSWRDHLFNRDNAELLVKIVGGFASLVTIHKYLKGRKAEVVEEGKENVTIQIDGDNNSVTVNKRVFNIYKDNVTISKAIQQNFEMLNDDAEIDGVEITDVSEGVETPMLHVDRGEFAELSKANAYMDRETIDEVHTNQHLYIKKPNLMPEKDRVWKWEFVHKGRDIAAKVTDPALAQKINEGLRVGQGDRIIADIKIGYKFSKQFNTFVESNTYDVVRVHELKHRDEQGSIEFD